MDIAEFAPESELPTLYEQKVDVADHVSDRLRLSADQVVKRADIEAKIENLNSRLSAITEETGKANAVKEAIALQISKFDDSIDLQEMSLEAMINLCEQRVEQEESALERKRQLEHSLVDTEIRIKRKREELKTIESDQSNWVLEWGQAIDGLGLKTDVHPEHATETFDQHLRLKIASLILEQRIEDYRKKNQAPVLARAGEFFSKLTLGSYPNLRDELVIGV